jgi:hypothetical protein
VLPPIPNPQIPATTAKRPTPPSQLKAFMVCELILTIAGLIYCDGGMTGSLAADFVFYLGFSFVWWIILWCLWQGQNWARIVAMIGCVLGIVGMMLPSQHQGDIGAMQQLLEIISSVMAAYFLWLLRSRAIVQFCKGKPA